MPRLYRSRYTQDVWEGWGYEDPLIYFDKSLRRWRSMFHQFRKGGLNHGGGAGTWPEKGASTDPNIMSGGYAISNTPSLFGGWTVSPPGFGAGYSKVVNFTATGGAQGTPGWPVVDPPQAGVPAPPRPYVFGPVAVNGGFRNDSMPSWGGNGEPCYSSPPLVTLSSNLSVTPRCHPHAVMPAPP